MKFLILLIYLFYGPFSSGQSPINNLFVNSTENIMRLDFSNGGDPTVSYTGFGSGASIGEGIAHTENADGEVILLVNSSGVFDKTGTKMPGSTGILAHPSSTEIVICKKPQSANLYYIVYNNQLCSSLMYSVVDLSQRNGLGDVVELNRVLDNTFQYAEGLEIVGIPCSNDYYLLAYRCYTGITRFRISASGFSGPTLIHQLNTNNHGGRGELDYHKGKIGYGITFTNKVFVADFDVNTGAIANPLTVTFPATNGIYGMEFSPDGTRIYATDLDNRDFFGNVSSPNLFSYQFSTNNISSWTLSNAGNTCNSVEPQGLGQIEIGKDHRLYIPVVGGCKVYVVNDPDGTPEITSIESTSVLSTGISDHIQSDFLEEYSTPDLEVTSQNDDVLLCKNEFIKLETADINGLSYQWYIDDQMIPGANSSSLQISVPGKYHVYAVDENECGKNSSPLVITPASLGPIDLGEDQVICKGESIQLKVEQSGEVEWSDGDTSGSRIVSEPGDYSVTLRQGDCFETAEITVRVLDIKKEDVPNVITPGNDEVNQYWVLPTVSGSTKVQIVNRWGEEVYFSDNYLNDWDAGFLSGGVYYYIVTSPLSCMNFRGWVHVLK